MTYAQLKNELEGVRPVNNPQKRFWIIVLLLAFVMASLLVIFSFQKEPEKLLSMQVQQGQLQDIARGTGTIKGLSYSLVSSIEGRVAEITHQTSDIVASGDVIMRLTNPELTNQLEKASKELVEQNAEKRALIAQLNLEQVLREETRLKLRSEIAEARLESHGKKRLSQSGAVSQIEYQKIQLQVKNLEALLDLNLKKETFSDEAAKAKVESIAAKIDRLTSERSRLAEQATQLVLKTQHPGVLTLESSLKEGDIITRGSKLGEVADPNDAIAEVLFPAFYSNQLALGGQLEINMNKSVYMTTIVKIYPKIEKNFVRVEARFEQLPSELKENTAFSATLKLQPTDEVLFVESPQRITPNHSYSYTILRNGVSLDMSLKFSEAINGKYPVIGAVQKGDVLVAQVK